MLLQTPGTPLRSGPLPGPEEHVATPAADSPVTLDRLSPRAAVAAWLAAEPGIDVASALAAVIRGDARIELEPDEIAGVIADARGEGLDPEQTFDRLILQGEWLSLNRQARIRPR